MTQFNDVCTTGVDINKGSTTSHLADLSTGGFPPERAGGWFFFGLPGL